MGHVWYTWWWGVYIAATCSAASFLVCAHFLSVAILFPPSPRFHFQRLTPIWGLGIYIYFLGFSCLCMFRAGFSVGFFLRFFSRSGFFLRFSPRGSWAMAPQIFGFGFWLAPSPGLFSCMCVCVCDVCVYSVLCCLLVLLVFDDFYGAHSRPYHSCDVIGGWGQHARVHVTGGAKVQIPRVIFILPFVYAVSIIPCYANFITAALRPCWRNPKFQSWNVQKFPVKLL